MNILFTCAGRRTYLLKYFKEQLGDNGLIIAGDMQLSAPALTAADIKVQLPSVYSENYVPILLNISKTYGVDALFSLNDLELPILAKNKKLFKEIGVSPIVSDLELIDLCFDKLKMSEFVKSIGLISPKVFISISECISKINSQEVRFPIILKPRWGSGSIGIEVVDNEKDLRLAFDFLCGKIKRTILRNVSDEKEQILIQEFISGNEYGLDIINDLNGSYVTTVVKKKIAMRAGETDKAMTIYSSELNTIGSTIGINSHHIANLDCDILESDGNYYVIDMNPRFGGGFPFSYEAGVNLPAAIFKWLKSEKVDVNTFLNPVIGKTFAKCDYLVEIF